MLWTYQGLKKVGVVELWVGGARRVAVDHGLKESYLQTMSGMRCGEGQRVNHTTSVIYTGG